MGAARCTAPRSCSNSSVLSRGYAEASWRAGNRKRPPTDAFSMDTNPWTNFSAVVGRRTSQLAQCARQITLAYCPVPSVSSELFDQSGAENRSFSASFLAVDTCWLRRRIRRPLQASLNAQHASPINLPQLAPFEGRNLIRGPDRIGMRGRSSSLDREQIKVSGLISEWYYCVDPQCGVRNSLECL